MAYALEKKKTGLQLKRATKKRLSTESVNVNEDNTQSSSIALFQEMSSVFQITGQKTRYSGPSLTQQQYEPLTQQQYEPMMPSSSFLHNFEGVAAKSTIDFGKIPISIIVFLGTANLVNPRT
jgi:hypothetical protein